jgi:effector-binding domain-containing protein
MKALKILLFVVLGLVGLVLILGLVAPKEVSADRSIVIDAPQEAVFNTVNDFKSWESWSPWKAKDESMEITYGDQTVGEGASYSWVSDASGNGKMKMVESEAPERIRTEIEFDGQGTAYGSWDFEAAENGGTKATWGFNSRFPFPFNAMLLFQDIGAAVGNDFEAGLALLKDKVEKESSKLADGQKIDGFDIKVVELPMHHFLAIQETIKMDKISEHYQENLPKVHKAAMDNKLEMAGMPCGLFYTWDEEKGETKVAQAVPIKSSAKVDGFKTLEVPESKALLIEYYGDYSGSAAAHGAMEKYIQQTGVEATVPAIEEYVTDPSTEPDPQKWLTRIYYPIKS